MPANNPKLTKTYAAGGVIAGYRIVNLSADGTVVQSDAATDALWGVADMNGAVASGDPVDVHLLGLAEVQYGGTITCGDKLTADADGKAISVSGVSASSTVQALIAGGSAGDHTVTGIALADTLVSVFEQDGTSGLLTDRTSEFTISAADTINNTGGTDTTGDKLLITYVDASSSAGAVRTIGIAEVSGVAGDIGGVLLNQG
jgi:hypothetical protein